MPLEAVVLCLDNSEWMRNGDYLPTRMQNQAESAVRITSTVVNGNAESSLGMLSMAGDNVQLLASPTRETDKLVASLKKVQLGGQAQFYKSLCVAQIALKYVKNPNGSKRIIAFVGSPLQETAEKLTKLAQYLRMQQIRVDVICLGEIEGNREKLTSFVQTNSREGHQSHLVEVPRGVALMEAIFASPIFGGAGGAAGGGFGGGAVGGGGGVDDDMGDAELQMAMRMSAEEARNSAQQGQGVASGNVPAPVSSTTTTGGGDFGDEDPELMMALQMSMMDTGVANVSIQSTSPTPTIEQSLSGGVVSSPGSIEYEDDDAAALALALAMSQEQPSSSSSDSSSSSSSSSGGGNNNSSSNSNSNSNSGKSIEAASAVGSSDIDPEYLAQLLKNVDVDPNDLLIQSTGLFDGKPKDSKDKDDKEGGSSDGGAGSNKRSQPEK